jgi:hypothetical protein
MLELEKLKVWIKPCKKSLDLLPDYEEHTTYECPKGKRR